VSDLHRLLPPLRALVRQAAAAILAVYRGDFGVTVKQDASPVTAADLAAERIILAGLGLLAPDIPAVSEEATASGRQVDVGAGRFWLVDPLDGTKEFVKRNGEFTINIALVEDGTPVLGVLYAPVADRLFAALPGEATVEEGGRPPRRIACRQPPPGGLTVLSSRSHRNPAAFDAFVRPYAVAVVHRLGSSLKFGLIATGEADLYPRFGRTMEWDTAAGHAILRAAGGCLTSLDGAPLTYGKSGFANPPFVAWGTREPTLVNP
jgi:3'(2'), 5'-bisphosphate nucleotidase